MTETLPRALHVSADGRLTDERLLGDRALLRLLGVLDVDGEAARVVGGAVRNTLLGRPVADVDVTTTALPEEVMRRARKAGFRPIPTGIEHGTVTVMVSGTGFEVTTLRQDVETDGRHAVVRFARDFAADAARRDFTINALSVGRDGRVHDTTDGIADLAAGRVRFIGDADARIREDFLRILRFFRFHASYAVGPLDAEGLEASRQNRDGLTRLSRERVRSEWLKLLGADGAVPALAGAIMAGIAERVVPGPCRLDRLARLAGFEADVGSAPDSLLRLAALCVATPDDVARLRENLRLANDERDRLLAGLAARDSLAEGPPALQGLRTLLFNFGPRAARDGVLLAGAGTPADASLAPWTAAFGLLKTIDVPRLPVGGKDILAQGVGNGRRVGAILKRLQAAWIRAGFPDSPSELARLLAEAIAAEE